MKKLLYIIILFLILTVSCGPGRELVYENYDPEIQSATIMNYNYLYNKVQFDSACYNDSIPNDISLWMNSGYVDYETGNYIELHLYYKTQDSLVTEMYNLNISEDSIYNYSKTIFNY